MHSLAKKEFANPFFLNGIIWIKLLPVGFQFLIHLPSSTHHQPIVKDGLLLGNKKDPA